MKYQNTITGAIIDIKSTIIEGPWQALEPATSCVDKAEVAPVQPKRRKAVKKSE